MHVGQCTYGLGYLICTCKELVERVVIATKQTIACTWLDFTVHKLVAIPDLVVFDINGDLQLGLFLDRTDDDFAVSIASDHTDHTEIR